MGLRAALACGFQAISEIRNIMKQILQWSVAAVLLSSPLAFAQSKVDPDLPEYTPVPGISGTLNSVGSDTLNNLMLMWGEGFRAIYPSVNIQIQGAGSSTAPAALIDGTAQIGPMSREMTGAEIDRFEARYGHKQTDRKSTRLNSSHVAISYAVFCLKKKTPLQASTKAAVSRIVRV